MKNTAFALFLAITACTFAAGASAQYVGPGSSPAAENIRAILARPVDDQYVTLRGKIVRQIRGDQYLFSDGTGEIRVDIDNHLFPHNRPITHNVTVEITGEIDAEPMEPVEIDVKQLRIVE